MVKAVLLGQMSPWTSLSLKKVSLKNRPLDNVTTPPDLCLKILCKTPLNLFL